MDDLAKEEREGIERLVTSMAGKLPFTAPELMTEKIRTYIETAWLRGRSAGVEETRRMLGTALPNSKSQGGSDE